MKLFLGLNKLINLYAPFAKWRIKHNFTSFITARNKTFLELKKGIYDPQNESIILCFYDHSDDY